MTHRYICLLLILLLPQAGLAAGHMQREADQAAGKWLALVDGGLYETSWARTATLFRQQVSIDNWVRAATAARRPLGNMQSRKLISATHMTSLPGAPDGDYVVLQYQTRFRNKRKAIETVTPMLDDGEWRVSGYYVR